MEEEEPIYAYDPVGVVIESGTCVIAGSSAVTQCEESDDLAIGMYFTSPSDPRNPDCGALRPIKVVTGHRRDENGELIDVIYGCKGLTDTYEYPDIFIADDIWKPYLIYVLGFIAIGLLIKIVLLVK
jgi:hypothetical protein